MVDKSQKKKEINTSITVKLQKLKSSRHGDAEAMLSTIKSKYLNDVFATETDCDAEFNQLISRAQSEYKAAELGDQSLPDWSAQYESARAQARADALTIIANSLI